MEKDVQGNNSVGVGEEYSVWVNWKSRPGAIYQGWQFLQSCSTEEEAHKLARRERLLSLGACMAEVRRGEEVLESSRAIVAITANEE